MFFIAYLDSGEVEEPDMNNICRTASAAILVMVCLSAIVDDHGHNGAFVGAGVNRILGDKWAVKLEIRDTFDVNEISDSQFIEGRAGVLFSWD